MSPLLRIATSASLVSILAFGAVPRAGDAQLGFLNTLGYGAVGLTAGAAIGAGVDCSDFICAETVMLALIGGTVGVGIGRSVGESVEADVDAGVPARNRGPAAVGAVLGGGVLGLMAAGVLVDVSGGDFGSGTILGSDEQTFAILGTAGAALSVLYLRSKWGELSGAGASVGPALVGGKPGVSVSVTF